MGRAGVVLKPDGFNCAMINDVLVSSALSRELVDEGGHGW